MSNEREFYYTEEIYPDGDVKHIYDDPPLPLDEINIQGVIKDFLNQLGIKPTVLVLRDLLVAQDITIDCSVADDLPQIIERVLSEEESHLHFLYSIPSADALIVGLKFHNCTYDPEQLYRISGKQIVKVN